MLDSWVFKNFILVVEPFAQSLRVSQTFVLVNNDLCGKLASVLESSMIFEEISKVTSVPFFIPEF